jgi:hypothetical protein
VEVIGSGKHDTTTITAIKSFIVQALGFYYQADSIKAPILLYLGYLETYFSLFESHILNLLILRQEIAQSNKDGIA